MVQIKLKGIIIKETAYRDNDKIVTILTDKLGKISCMVKGAKKTTSPFLACSQYLVYSEFIITKSKNFYYINSAEVLNTFYKFRVDFEKLEMAFELTRLLNYMLSENEEDTSEILTLFLNTIYLLEKNEKDNSFVRSVFKLKLFCMLGFCPNVNGCSICGHALEKCYFDYVSNIFICDKCYVKKNQDRCLSIDKSVILAIIYIYKSDIKKVFSFEITNVSNLEIFVNTYQDILINDI